MTAEKLIYTFYLTNPAFPYWGVFQHQRTGKTLLDIALDGLQFLCFLPLFPVLVVKAVLLPHKLLNLRL